MGKMRLDKFLAETGVGTRSEVKKMIKAGKIKINNEKALKPEQKINPDTDEVYAEGNRITYAPLEYYMLNKPAGVVSATQDGREKTVLDCLGGRKRKDLFPVGRLDKDTEGLLLITNDGGLAHNLLSPKKHVDKTYYVKFLTPLEKESVLKLEQGVDIGEKALTLPAEISGLDEASRSCFITIREGKFHQIKRMFQAVDNKVVYLKRISMGSLTLDEKLKPGEYRTLEIQEIERLKKHVGESESSSV